ncbi:hypothetical protein [Paenibacillus sp. DMB20]|uniref:hypothetical protein n=1 Tax=Paenibacillus sp. DMB20 TaxID=1642570 RepID=UPI00128D9BC1|nr:hypothetical protein [Paenibacillus sp. DMB20]
MNLPRTFVLNEEGYALIQKLVQLRMDEDLAFEYHGLRTIEEKHRNMPLSTGMVQTLSRAPKNHAAAKAAERIRKKEARKTCWADKNLSPLPPSLKNMPVEPLIKRFNESSHGRIQLFLIMQEVMHTPVYEDAVRFQDAVEETNHSEHADTISQICGFGSWGRNIQKNTETFFKEIRDEGGTMLQWGISGPAGYGSVAAALDLPALAPAIAGLLGSSGEAAFTADLAIMGGGSVAVGGFGTADGMTVLAGGSSLLGAVAGGSAGNLLGQIPHEAVALSVVKAINLIQYLKSDDNRDRAGTIHMLNQAQELFLGFKHQAEREMALHGIYGSKKDMMQMFHILNRAFRQIMK